MRKGTHHLEESKRKLSEINKGKILSEEHKRKISEAIKGEKNHNWGKPRSEETKRKISKFHKGMLGKYHSDETRRRISEANKGKKSSQWKGGISPIVELIRKSIKYRQWRQSIFIRDSFICQKCGQWGGKLHAHHKEKSFSKLIEEVKANLPLLDLYSGAMAYTPLWDISNGITLCRKCHKKTKNYLKRRKDVY